jgi:long-chain acyl-CoA synthetase
MKNIVLLTGASGFIGTQIARYLLKENPQLKIFALIHASSKDEATCKLSRCWWDWPELTSAIGSRVEVLCGDVSLTNLGLDETTYVDVEKQVTHIIHAAADWRLISIEELQKTNVTGTSNMLELARKIHKDHGLTRFSHISTAYVAGARMGYVPEDALTDEYGFFTAYERSKYQGECLVQKAKNEFPVSIFRPSMVVGDSQTGAIKTFNTFYYPLRLYLTGTIRILPVSRSLRINIVPVDYVAKAIVNLTFNIRAEGQNFHLVAPYEALPTIGELLDFVREWAKNQLKVDLAKPICLSMSTSAVKSLFKIQGIFGNQRTSNALESLAPYFNENRQLQRSNSDKLLGFYELNWQDFLPKLLEYAIYHSFFHRSERTVYEQVLFRLESKSRPIIYYDIVKKKLIKHTADEVKRDILTTASALHAMGIVAGDRVALTGLNTTRYLVVDIAIGLLGAISVPLYYTTPPSDIDQILKASNSKMFLIGIPSLLARINELTTDIPIVSFCREELPQKIAKKVFSWKTFLDKSAKYQATIQSPVGFGDIATLRYSSGTTGTPKGAIFTHANLRYMAESTVSITSWQHRNQKSVYLSFLPMGHVVEGILATYSPYYYPAPVKIYFLEDFKGIQQALPKVRPSLFFSVPRVYEKVWEGLSKNWLGKLYHKQKPGLVKTIIGKILRRITLRRAGLNKCGQLIVGSASIDEKLLENFRNIGVEIYNAYGLTEAPLITINRLGENKIGTVGKPMPMTQVKIGEDGEILVKGPQVTAGYYDANIEPPFRDGWLLTGDLGSFTADGSLILFGRRKEFIKTSYGKGICSGKIESMLREISNVSEAILIGESRPYCVALLWINASHLDQKTTKIIDSAIVEMNNRLSNPEKVKRWALLANTLSIENGELTPNLKLKRNILMQRYMQIIEALYNGKELTKNVHIGRASKEE